MDFSKEIVIGILGGGQLAKMSAQAAQKLGFSVIIFEQDANAPAVKITHNAVIGQVSDKEAIKRFVDKASVITLENEFISYEVLEYIESLGKPVNPGAATLRIIQDKLLQKDHLKNAGLPVVEFASIESLQDAIRFGRENGYPFLLKSRKGGYDGYGNRTIHSENQIAISLTELGFPEKGILAEAFVKFQSELAVMVARSKSEKAVAYPVVETIHENHICKLVKAPAIFDEEFLWGASDLARAAVESVRGIGMFGVEMFYTETGSLLINEMAPRPHNSGHYSIEACTTSQFENHIRAVLDLPIGEATMRVPAAVMINILGKRNAAVSMETIQAALSNKNTSLHIYGKPESRIGRKMGHITATGLDFKECLKAVTEAEQKIVL
ncbi:MAG: 5-(carboxyamino)imidazole ribonucleotide synthase [Chloroherpetonaceae bacterium]|nr:5-(carboxyamino)imidazole ribonucleotide synthase [Chloroherpetonaceae bacterium]